MQQLIQNTIKVNESTGTIMLSCDALHNLVPFIQFKERKKTH